MVVLLVSIALVAGAGHLGIVLGAPAAAPGASAGGSPAGGAGAVQLVSPRASTGSGVGNAARHPDGVDARIVVAAPSTWDPALAGDADTAQVLAQVDETLTSLDAASRVQPALAASWTTSADARQVTFRLRSGLTFSDGTPLTGADVVRSWLRLLDPAQPSPLASLLGDVVGAQDRLAGRAGAEAVGIHASGDTVTVDFSRPAAYFPAAAASPSLAVVPASIPAAAASDQLPAGLVVSGAYVPTSQDGSTIRLEANPHYWAGLPPLGTIEIVTDTGTTAPIDAFQSGDVDYVPVSASAAAWIAYDRTLGPQLRTVASPTVDYYGFDTTRPPFDDARVRSAFAQAVDWKQLVRLSNRFLEPATSIVPPGIPGRSTTDFQPVYDPAAARARLAAAGYPDGEGLPAVTLDSGGFPYDEAIARQLKANLGLDITVEELTSGYFDRLASDPPQMWGLSWIADYPDAQDFLGLLLTTGSSANYGAWSDPDYDAAIEAAASTADAAQRKATYDEAQRILQAQAPIIPVAYEPAFALSRTGLLGAGTSGVGLLRFASLAWAP
ncbi:MAG TPA: peptide ABC transporter substrate-binding protein [Candidatus Limnocylindrales bacterium]|nr:peptide ABC transporter substrate-binding protein [Candidatus Limnocylindrales bacterium]